MVAAFPLVYAPAILDGQAHIAVLVCAVTYVGIVVLLLLWYLNHEFADYIANCLNMSQHGPMAQCSGSSTFPDITHLIWSQTHSCGGMRLKVHWKTLVAS